jgi:hypothetical protein
LPSSNPGCADNLGSGADADDDRVLGRMALDPLQVRRVVVTTHGGDDDIVCTFRMPRIEFRGSRLRLDLERRKKRHRPRLRCQRDHIGNIGAPKDAKA